MEDVEMIQALDRHMVRARAFNEAANALVARDYGYQAAAEVIKSMRHAEIAAFDALWDKYQNGRHSKPAWAG